MKTHSGHLSEQSSIISEMIKCLNHRFLMEILIDEKTPRTEIGHYIDFPFDCL